MKRRYVGIAAALVVAASSTAGWASQPRADLVDRLQAAGASVIAGRDGNPHFIRTSPGAAIPVSALPLAPTPEGIARAALADYGPLFGIDNPSTQLLTERVLNDGARSTSRFQQLHQGLPVIGGELLVNAQGSAVTSINGRTAPKINVDTSPKVSADAASDTAIQAIAKAHDVNAGDLVASAPELSVYVPSLIGPGDDHALLAWRTEVRLPGAPIIEFVLVDAINGGVLLNFNQVDTALSRVTYNAAGGAPTSTTGLAVLCNDSTPCPTSDTDAVAAHLYAADTYNFYSSHFGRNSIDNAGMQIVSIVHYYASTDCPNAWWDGTKMTYCNSLALGDDVVGHEMTHGVTQHTSNLFYYYQSGAINEALSDLFGEFIDLTNGHGNDAASKRWLLGEDLPAGLFGAGYTALRNMKDPTQDFGTPDPDKMTSGYYYTSSGDNGGVHHNAGINNKAVYLMTDGGTFNGRTVTGIGIDKVAAIYYRVQTSYLTSGSDYNDLYQALQQACSALTGTGGITTNDCTQVRVATEAVEMNRDPTGSFAPEATPCPAHVAKSTVLFSEDFESTSKLVPSNSSVWQVVTGYATAGTHSLQGLDSSTATDTNAAMYYSLGSLPANSYLWFRHAFSFEGTSTFYDGGVVEYSTNGGTTWSDASTLIQSGKSYGGTIASAYGNPLAGRSAFVGTSHGYVSTRLNLATLAGQTVLFRWRIGTDSSGGALGWVLDDISFHICSGTANAYPFATPDFYSANENTTLSVSAANGLLVNDTDPDGDPLTLGNAQAAINGTASVFSDGHFTYTPPAGWFGTDTFAYTARDSYSGTSSLATVTVTVLGTRPTTPTGFRVDLDTTSLHYVVSWTDASSNENGFRVYRAVGDGVPVVIADLAAGSTTYTDADVQSGVTYNYYVVSYRTCAATGAVAESYPTSPIASSFTIDRSGGGGGGGGGGSLGWLSLLLGAGIVWRRKLAA